MNYRITILCENSVGPVSGTLGEHGFSALIEWESGGLLFDTGQGLTLLHNAQRMNKNLHRVERVALSHGHYDHSGGLLPLLRNCGPKQVFAHPDVFSPRYRVNDRKEALAIGMPYPRDHLEGHGACFKLSDRFREIAPGIFLTGQIPRNNAAPADAGLSADPAGTVPDPFSDDQSLLLRTPAGTVVILGCCHAGLSATLRRAVELTDDDRIVAVVGGTHLGFCSEQHLETTLNECSLFRVQRWYPAHCTGLKALLRLQQRFPGAVLPAQVGTGFTC